MPLISSRDEASPLAPLANAREPAQGAEAVSDTEEAAANGREQRVRARLNIAKFSDAIRLSPQAPDES